MTVATDTLALAQSAYQNALAHLSVQVNINGGERRIINHDIAALLSQVKYWQQQVDAETARAVGHSSRAPLRFKL